MDAPDERREALFSFQAAFTTPTSFSDQSHDTSRTARQKKHFAPMMCPEQAMRTPKSGLGTRTNFLVPAENVAAVETFKGVCSRFIVTL